MFGVCIGTMALIIVLSVFNGFENLVTSLYNDFYSDLVIEPSSGKMLNILAMDEVFFRVFYFLVVLGK